MIIWQNQLVPHSFYKLKKLNVHDCRNLKKVFPDNMLRMIQNLEELEILNCASVEEIFEINGVNVEETIDTAASMSRKVSAHTTSFVNMYMTSHIIIAEYLKRKLKLLNN